MPTALKLLVLIAALGIPSLSHAQQLVCIDRAEEFDKIIDQLIEQVRHDSEDLIEISHKGFQFEKAFGHSTLSGQASFEKIKITGLINKMVRRDEPVFKKHDEVSKLTVMLELGPADISMFSSTTLLGTAAKRSLTGSLAKAEVMLEIDYDYDAVDEELSLNQVNVNNLLGLNFEHTGTNDKLSNYIVNEASSWLISPFKEAIIYKINNAFGKSLHQWYDLKCAMAKQTG